VTVLLLFDCQKELHFQDPKRNHGDPSQIDAERVRTPHECMLRLHMALQIQNQSETGHQCELKTFGVQSSHAKKKEFHRLSTRPLTHLWTKRVVVSSPWTDHES
jgi:hypothetical protein